MRVVFMGTPEFAVPSLRSLFAGHEVAAVFTRPDSVSSRGREVTPSPVATAASAMGIPVHKVETLRSESVLTVLGVLAPDIIVVAAFGHIVPPEVLSLPPLGCINVHASLLPRWRGAAPVQRAILAGDTETGVSIMQMEEGLDTGPYCLTAATGIAEKNTDELTAELAAIGASILVEALESIGAGTCVWTEQDDESATYAHKITRADVALDPGLSVSESLRRIRASSDSAPIRLTLAGKNVRVLEAQEVETESVVGGAVECTRAGLVIGVADGGIRLVSVKPDGKGVMRAADWMCGLRLDEPRRWESLL